MWAQAGTAPAGVAACLPSLGDCRQGRGQLAYSFEDLVTDGSGSSATRRFPSAGPGVSGGPRTVKSLARRGDGHMPGFLRMPGSNVPPAVGPVTAPPPPVSAAPAPRLARVPFVTGGGVFRPCPHRVWRRTLGGEGEYPQVYGRQHGLSSLRPGRTRLRRGRGVWGDLPGSRPVWSAAGRGPR